MIDLGIKYGDCYWPLGSYITMYMGRNTFSLFQNFGGISMPLLTRVSSDGQSIDGTCLPFTKEDAIKLLCNMTEWANSVSANVEAKRVGSDLIFVSRQLLQLAEVIEGNRPGVPIDFCYEMFGNDDLEEERQREMADNFSDEHWTACAESA